MRTNAIYVVCGIGLKERTGSQWVHRAFGNLEEAQKCRDELNMICNKENLNAVYFVSILIVE